MNDNDQTARIFASEIIIIIKSISQSFTFLQLLNLNLAMRVCIWHLLEKKRRAVLRPLSLRHRDCVCVCVCGFGCAIIIRTNKKLLFVKWIITIEFESKISTKDMIKVRREMKIENGRTRTYEIAKIRTLYKCICELSFLGNEFTNTNIDLLWFYLKMPNGLQKNTNFGKLLDWSNPLALALF